MQAVFEEQPETNMIHNDGKNLSEADIPILVVDDLKANLDLMEALLMGEGFAQVLLAEHGEQALTLLEQYPNIGVVLLDLMMPDMDGYEICKRIADNPRTRDIPIIVVTGAAYRQNEALLKSFAVGANDFLTKPLNEIELFARIRSAMALYRERVLRQASVRTALENETRFRAIINQAPVGIAHIDARGRFLLVNDRLCTLSGYSGEELAYTTLQALTFDRKARTSLNALLQQPGDRQRMEMKVRLRTKQTALVWTHLSITPLSGVMSEHKPEDTSEDNSEDTSYVLIMENISD